MNSVNIKLSKFIPGTLQCVKIGEYLGKSPSARTRLSILAEIIAQIDVYGNRRKRVLVFSKSTEPEKLAISVHQKKIKLYREITSKDPLVANDEKYIKIMSLRSNILILETNRFNMRTVYKQTLNILKENIIEAIIIEGMNMDNINRNKLIMLSMRSKCQIITIK